MGICVYKHSLLCLQSREKENERKKAAGELVSDDEEDDDERPGDPFRTLDVNELEAKVSIKDRSLQSTLLTNNRWESSYKRKMSLIISLCALQISISLGIPHYHSYDHFMFNIKFDLTILKDFPLNIE